MKKIVLIIAYMHNIHAIIFQGIVESNINKNSFLCPNNNSSNIPCTNQSMNYNGFDFAQLNTLQIFNNQAYWLHQESIAEQYALNVETYTANNITQHLQNEGWIAMGCYCILVTTDPLVTNLLSPELKAGNGEIKVVAQLQYAGTNFLELWDQDVAIVPETGSIQITLSSSPSTQDNNTESTNNNQDNILMATKFTKIHRNDNTYNAAKDSPRSIKITIAG